jgi:hypothetical protein
MLLLVLRGSELGRTGLLNVGLDVFILVKIFLVLALLDGERGCLAHLSQASYSLSLGNCFLETRGGRVSLVWA